MYVIAISFGLDFDVELLRGSCLAAVDAVVFVGVWYNARIRTVCCPGESHKTVEKLSNPSSRNLR